jgi:uncharacterized protein YecE (DUF72 family)
MSASLPRPPSETSKQESRRSPNQAGSAQFSSSSHGPSRMNGKTEKYFWGLQKRFQEFPLVVEVRHASWITEEILDTFAALGLGLRNIDQPLFHRSAHTTSAVGYVRLHGRNYQNWFSPKSHVRARYDESA